MLILTRRIDELIKIGKEVEVKIIGLKGNQVRLGISAPQEIAVDRLEISEKKDHNSS